MKNERNRYCVDRVAGRRLKKILSWVCAILLEIPYFLLFWWWYATLMKALGKKYPPVWPWKVGTSREGKKVPSSSKSSPKKTR